MTIPSTHHTMATSLPSTGHGDNQDHGNGARQDPGHGARQDPGNGASQDPGHGVNHDPAKHDPGPGAKCAGIWGACDRGDIQTVRDLIEQVIIMLQI